MGIELRLPNIKGNDREQLAQIRSYLYQLTEQLQWALNNGSTSASNYVAQQIPSANVSAVRTPSESKTTDKRLETKLNAMGWYKIGTMIGNDCAVVTITFGGAQASPSMVDIATEGNAARASRRLQSLNDGQMTKVGIIKESTTATGVYAYYNNASENLVCINIHTHMGTFISAGLIKSNVTDNDMHVVEILN